MRLYKNIILINKEPTQYLTMSSKIQINQQNFRWNLKETNNTFKICKIKDNINNNNNNMHLNYTTMILVRTKKTTKI